MQIITWHVSSMSLTSALKVLYKVILLTQTITSASITVFNRNDCSNFFLLLCSHISMMLYYLIMSAGSSSYTMVDKLAVQTVWFLTRKPLRSLLFSSADQILLLGLKLNLPLPGCRQRHVNSQEQCWWFASDQNAVSQRDLYQLL